MIATTPQTSVIRLERARLNSLRDWSAHIANESRRRFKKAARSDRRRSIEKATKKAQRKGR